ncbi:MAG: cation transporter [Candidatus Angelobacter sp. Gp1-AA117]|nr:MAG: cation transporter [Candidatus Angelobacter sp. Gp1-AA117]
MHAHNHSHGEHSARVLRLSLVATFLYVVLTVVAGLRAHSLALLSEAGHNVTDLLALVLSWVAVFVQMRPPSSTKTFGYHRAGVLAAFLNALTLVAIAFYIFYEAVERLYRPVQVHPTLMIWVAAAGVVMNGAIAWFLYKAAHDVNIRSVFIHQIGDTLSTAAVIAGGWIILWTGRNWVDPVLSLGIGCMILWSSLGIIRETLNILLEGIPHGMSVEHIIDSINAIDGVNDVHDVHVWSIGSDRHALSCHISIEDIPPSESEAILRNVNRMLAASFHIHHTTIQFENAVCEIAHGCVIPVSHSHQHSHPERV